MIVNAAIKSFAEYGFGGTTTREISLASGISEASLFQHFKSKAELYTSILEDKSKQVYEKGWMDEINGYVEGNEDEKLFAAIAMKINEYCRADPNLIRLMRNKRTDRGLSAPDYGLRKERAFRKRRR